MYRSLQAGRAVAASMVVLFHLGGTFAQDKYFGFKALDGPFSWGDAGVEFFFVLSGFLFTLTTRADFGRPSALPTFVARRALRIYPTYWVICLLVCVAATAMPAIRQSLPSDPWTFVKALALIPQDPLVVGGTGAPILFVAWSLQYELLFYALIAMAIVSRALGIVISIALLAVCVHCQLGTGCTFPASFLSNNLLFVFALGVAGACVTQSRIRIPAPLMTGVAAAIGFVAFGCFEIRYGRDTLPVDRRLIYGAIGTIAIVALARAEDLGQLRWKQRWIKLLGDSSYALYLIHIPIISVMCKLLLKAGPMSPGLICVAFAFVFLTCVGASVVFHLTIERPMLRWLGSWRKRGAATTREVADVALTARESR